MRILFIVLLAALATACNRDRVPTAENTCKHQLSVCGQDPEKVPECITSLHESINVYRELLKREENKSVAKLASDEDIYACLMTIQNCGYFSVLEVREYCYFPSRDRKQILRDNTGIRDWPPLPKQSGMIDDIKAWFSRL